jgi:hypothetical protein
MKTSETIGKLATALAAARKEFRPVLKKSVNPFFKSKYAELSEVIEATSAALSDNGLSVVQTPGHVVLLDGTNRVTVESRLVHSSGEWIESGMSLPLSKFDAQGAGSAITYARRYAYQSIVGVAAEPDDDANAASDTFQKSLDGKNFTKQEPAPRGRPPIVKKDANGYVESSPIQKPKSVSVQEKPCSQDTKTGDGAGVVAVPTGGRPVASAFIPTTNLPEKKSTSFPFGHSANQPSTGDTGQPPVHTPEASSASPGANIHGVNITDKDLPLFGPNHDTIARNEANVQALIAPLPKKPITKEQEVIKERLHKLVPDEKERTKLFDALRTRFKVSSLSELSIKQWEVVFAELEKDKGVINQ